MSHVILQCVVTNSDRTAKRKRLNDIAKCGGLVHVGPYDAVARKLSRLPWCDRVIATFVTEQNVGTWRDGRKS